MGDDLVGTQLQRALADRRVAGVCVFAGGEDRRALPLLGDGVSSGNRAPQRQGPPRRDIPDIGSVEGQAAIQGQVSRGRAQVNVSGCKTQRQRVARIKGHQPAGIQDLDSRPRGIRAQEVCVGGCHCVVPNGY